MSSELTKACSRCKQVKLGSDFFKDRSRVTGLSPQCKDCQRAYRKSRDPNYRTSGRGQQLWLVKDGMKRCCRCQTTKTVEEFSKNKIRPDGLQHYCKPCQYAAVKETDRKNPEGKKKRNRKASLKMKYGISVEEWDLMLLEQNGKCAICYEEMGNPHVDHDHVCCPGIKTCGKCVRALLCGNCNTSLGGFKDSPELLLRAVSYLDSYTKGRSSRPSEVE